MGLLSHLVDYGQDELPYASGPAHEGLLAVYGANSILDNIQILRKLTRHQGKEKVIPYSPNKII